MGILLAHLVGDYLLQSHWMATEKVRHWWPAWAHAMTYGMPFMFVTRSPLALVVIVTTHAVIDRYRLARHLVWLKNQVAPVAYRPGHTGTGYADDVPAWLAVWLLFVVDNTMHLLINVAAVRWL